VRVQTFKHLAVLGLVGFVFLVPQSVVGQTHIWIDVPSGETYSDTGAPPSTEVANWDMVEDEDLVDLTGSSFHSPSSSSNTGSPDWASEEYIEVKVNIPEAGEWYLWAHYIAPTMNVNSFNVLDENELFIGSPDGPSVDPVGFLDEDTPAAGEWQWGGAPLGQLSAGEHALYFLKRECVWGTGGEAAKPEENPHIELLYLTNGGADDRPENATFNSLVPFSCERRFEPYGFTRFGGDITVTLTARPGTESGSAVTVEETIPRGFRIEEMDASAGTPNFSVSKGVLTWEIPELSKEETLVYVIPVVGRTDPVPVEGTIAAGDVTRPVYGMHDIELISFRIIETFSYPLNMEANENKGKSLAEVDQQRGWGWSGGWVVGPDATDALDEKTLDAGLIESQPLANNPGNFSLKLTGASGDEGVRRSFNPVSIGELWLSFAFLDEGPASQHWAGLSFYDAGGNEVSFVGKPWDAASAGIGNLPGGDSLAEGVDYTEPHHYLVRYLLRAGEGQNDGVFLWIDPDREDTLATFDAGGDNIDTISNVATLRIARGEGDGSTYVDTIWIDSVPALPPEGSGRVEFMLDDPENRPEEWPGFDVVCVDQFDDAAGGWYGFGHDTGEDHYLLVTGFIYYDSQSNPTTQLLGYGLPVDHMSGLNGHILGPYNNQALELGYKTSMKFENTGEQYGPFTFDVVPPGNYAELRACMTVGNGDGQLLATFNYEDGSTSEGVFHADDWYDDPPGLRFPDVFQLVNDMNRISGNGDFDERFDPAFFENAAEVDETKVLTSVTLEFDPSVASSAYNLFDILAVPSGAEEPPTSVTTWMLR